MTETFCATQQVRVLTRQRLATSRNRVLRERPTRPQVWRGGSPRAVNCSIQTASISAAQRGNELRDART
jgi:hypothetical protein